MSTVIPLFYLRKKTFRRFSGEEDSGSDWSEEERGKRARKGAKGGRKSVPSKKRRYEEESEEEWEEEEEEEVAKTSTGRLVLSEGHLFSASC